MKFPSQDNENTCEKIKYLDCRSWYDFGQQLFTLTVIFVLFLQVAKHYRNLKKQKQQKAVSEHQKSIRRKIRVNLIQIIYLLCLMISTIYDLYLFFVYQDPDQRQNITIMSQLYKCSQIFYINWLNTLNLTVGFLYWKATRAYYVLSELTEPFLFRRFAKRIFFCLFCLNALAIVVSIIFIFTPQVNQQSAVTLVSTTLSIIVCVGCRILYRRYILTKVDLSKRAVIKEKIMSILLFVSSFLRILLYSLDTFDLNWSSSMKNQELSSQGKCLDTWPFYALALLFINLLINLLPAAIYGHLFVSEVDTKVKKSRQRLLSQQS